jgi:hypothetical protein
MTFFESTTEDAAVDIAALVSIFFDNFNQFQGQGLTELLTVTLSYYDMQCTPASFPPIVDISSCVATKQEVSSHSDYDWAHSSMLLQRWTHAQAG